MTIGGLNFGSYSFTPSATIAGAACSTMSWTSGTQMACLVSAQSYSKSLSQATVSALVGTRLFSFTFDGTPQRVLLSC